MIRKLLAPASIALFAVTASAQNSTTSVRGIVTDPTGAIISGGTVTLSDVKSHDLLTSTVGNNGEYSFYQVKSSTYKIQVGVSGFNTLEQTAELLVSPPATVNFNLTVGAATETVEVSATAALNFTDATIGNAISNAQIETMPIDSRNVADLLSLQPGVLATRSATRSIWDQTRSATASLSAASPAKSPTLSTRRSHAPSRTSTRAT